MKYVSLLALTIALASIALTSPVMAQSMLSLSNPAASSAASPGVRDRIAAVVNDNVITTLDIRQRMTLALLSSGLPESPEIEQRLLPQVLRGLIDEQLQLQEAKRLDITVTQEDIDKARGFRRDFGHFQPAGRPHERRGTRPARGPKVTVECAELAAREAGGIV